MTRHANCVVSIMFAKIARVAVVALVPGLADPRPAVVSSRKVNRLAAPWVLMPHIPALVLRVAHVLPLVAINVHTTQVRAMIISATAPKVHARRVLQAIVRKVIAHHFKIVVRVRREIAHKVIARRIKTAVLALKVIVHKATVLTKTVAHAHHVRPMLTRLNSVAGMYPMASIQAHV